MSKKRREVEKSPTTLYDTQEGISEAFIEALKERAVSTGKDEKEDARGCVVALLIVVIVMVAVWYLFL